MNLILNERICAEDYISRGYISNKPLSTLSLISRYWFDVYKDKSKVFDLLINYMKNNYANYTYAKWSDILHTIADKSDKYPLIEISSIGITRNEMKTIKEIKSQKIQRVAFTLLCFAKYYNIVNPKNADWVNANHNVIFSSANIDYNSTLCPIMLNNLYRIGLIKFNMKNDNTNICVQFVDNNSERVMEVSDFSDLGYQYMNYCGYGKFIVCADCHKLVKVNKKDTHTIRCRECQDRIDKQNRTNINKKYYIKNLN